MKLPALLTAAVALPLLAAPALGQPEQPYAGWQTRSIKALSKDQITHLKAGHGMGFALAAELNGYPGPRHVLDLGQQLALTGTQRARAQELFDSMKAETTALGERLIAAEADLDRQFAARTITPAGIDAATAAIGATQAKLRAAHLKYHLTMLALLTPEQVQRYNELRGYGNGAQPIHQMHHHAQ